MSDRRPSNLYVYRCVDDLWPPEYDYEPATVDEVLAVVRRGVESGEIEGWFKRWCVKHDCEGLGNAERGEVGCTGAGVGRAVDMDCRLVPVLMIEEQR